MKKNSSKLEQWKAVVEKNQQLEGEMGAGLGKLSVGDVTKKLVLNREEVIVVQLILSKKKKY